MRPLYQTTALSTSSEFRMFQYGDKSLLSSQNFIGKPFLIVDDSRQSVGSAAVSDTISRHIMGLHMLALRSLPPTNAISAQSPSESSPFGDGY